MSRWGWYSEQLKLGQWRRVKTARDPREHSSVRNKQRKIRNVHPIPEAAAKMTLDQLGQIMPGGQFEHIWSQDLADLEHAIRQKGLTAEETRE